VEQNDGDRSDSGTASVSTVTEMVKKVEEPNPYEDLIVEIANSVRSDVEEMDERGEEFERIGVRTKHIRKILALAAALDDEESEAA